MKQFLAVCLWSAAALLASVEDKETIRQTYPMTQKLEVRNVNGSIRVTGYSGSAIQMVVNKTLEARDASELDRAKREVRLDVQTGNGVLRLCVEFPGSSCIDSENRGNRGNWNDNHREYSARFDFELQVPASMTANLRTVNGGVVMKGVHGDFDVSSVNGGVTLQDLMGSGAATTVNGAIKLSFLENPKSGVRAKTVNGAIDAAFPRTLQANLKFKTFNGEVFTDFPATMLANEAPEIEMVNGTRRIRSNRMFGVRVGGGGPEHSFQTLNGTIQISERGQ